MAGYSEKPLGQKLGLKPGSTVLAVDAPVHYQTLIDEVDGVVIKAATPAELPAEQHAIVHFFCRDLATLGTHANLALDSVAPGGALWISWPKEDSPLHADLSEDGVRETVLPLGWVDVKVCAVDADWSALKFMKRRD